MNSITRQFLNLILEDDEKNEEEDEASKPKAKVLSVETDNKLSRGRPISDPGLANMKYRSNSEPSEAKAMLDELGISSGGGDNWAASLKSIMDSASSGEMSALISGANVVESPGGKPGVQINLTDLWSQDDANGKRSFGFIRAIIAASNKVGYFSANSTTVKNLRVEEIVGENAFLVYVSRKAKNWRQ